MTQPNQLSPNLQLDQEAATPAAQVSLKRKIMLVLPAYNEEESIVQLLTNIQQAMLFHSLEYEITVLDDGSTDRTLEIARSCASRMPLRILRHLKNAGLGATIRDGLSDAVQRAGEHDIIVTMDADNSHTPGLILRMVRAIDEGCDVVIASRFVSNAQVRGVNLFRRMLSRGASMLFQAVLPIPGVRDYTCGYRAYRSALLRGAFDRYRQSFVDQEGFQCMIDILLKLSTMTDTVFGEVPMILRYDLKMSQSKMRVASTIAGSLKLLLRRRLEFWMRGTPPSSP